ncbi:MAG: efflux RND transporter permease subunit, partial [Planctomycetota bacterium]
LQLRGAFFGLEAQRLQRDREELRLYVRRPLRERDSVADLLDLTVLTPGGGEIPLRQAARLHWQTGYSSIEREQGRRVIEVSADVDRSTTSAGQVLASLRSDGLQRLQETYPRLDWEGSGQQQRRQESLRALRDGMALALLAMYALLAIAFDSYLQPLLILLAIPFACIGAIGGHLLLGYDLSIVSAFGLVALAGVVVNDALVLISAINSHRADGRPKREAAILGSVERLRPVLLTSITTFVGLAPMILETSLQARFLVPMAISLGCGVLFVTVIVLVIVPAVYTYLPGRSGQAQPDGSG